MKLLVSLGLVIAGVIHLLPLGGVLGNEQLARLYGIPFTDTNLSILMRHRVVLFGLLGVFLVVAAFHPPFQLAAFVAGLVSVLSFIALATTAPGEYNAGIARVFKADLVALAGLLVGFGVYCWLDVRGH